MWMARRILAILLLAMAAGQLSNPAGFVDALEAYELGGRTAAWALAVSIMLAEVVSGVGLVRRGGIVRQVAPGVAVAVAVGWTTSEQKRSYGGSLSTTAAASACTWPSRCGGGCCSKMPSSSPWPSGCAARTSQLRATTRLISS